MAMPIVNMMTLKEAAKQGITRVRMPEWDDPNAYLEIDINSNGILGTWGHFNYPSGRQDIPIFFGISERWVPFDVKPKAKF